jgi:hypothetical protein
VVDGRVCDQRRAVQVGEVHTVMQAEFRGMPQAMAQTMLAKSGKLGWGFRLKISIRKSWRRNFWPHTLGALTSQRRASEVVRAPMGRGGSFTLPWGVCTRGGVDRGSGISRRRMIA